MRYKRLLTLGLMLGLPAVSQAAILTFALEGNVDTITNLTGSPVAVYEGDRAVLNYTFDSDAPHNNGVASYDGISSSLRIGDDVFTTVGLPNISVHAGTNHSSSVNSAVIGLGATGRMQFSLQSNRNDIFADGSLPEVPPDITLFSSKWFQVVINDATGSPQLGISGSIDSSYVVPEPLSAMFLGAGGLLMGGRRRVHV